MSAGRLPLPEGFPTDVHLQERLDGTLLPEGRWSLLGDENVRDHWMRNRLPEPPGSLWVPTSEATKRLEVLVPWLEAWASLPLHRDATVVAVGGVVLSDMAGLAASLFLRGVAWHCWPTTLLAQVDAGLGGKTAVNLEAGKNLAGAFHPPARMVVCTDFLSTLSARQLESGAWELRKHALIEGDLAWAERLLACGRPGIADLERSLLQKAGVVHRDLHEQGERKLLNLGHTLGHALESASGFELLHGEAVGLGTLAACLLSEEEGFPAFPQDFLARFADRLRPLAARVPAWEACRPVLARDKKAVGESKGGNGSAIHCVLPVSGRRAVLRLLAPDAWATAHARLIALLR
ncbi:MAG TPA: 3-dehydroquinate synthase family protein [Holophaga sp.]|nr:3-dehydroquinate synthase family protein [Holophaga sp.]